MPKSDVPSEILTLARIVLSLETSMQTHLKDYLRNLHLYGGFVNSTDKARSKARKRSSMECEDIDLEAAQTLYQDYLTRVLNEDVSALPILRDLIHATIGFELLSIKMQKPVQSIQRMVSDNGNPTCQNLMAIMTVIRKALNVQIAVTVVPAWKVREMEIEQSVSMEGVSGLIALD